MATTFQNVPDAAATGLDLFAAAWLEMWTARKGFVIIETSGEGWFGHGVDAPDRPEPAAELPDSVKRSLRDWHDGHFTGHMRALEDLLRLVPGGLAAVKAQVARFPNFAGADGVMGV
jgi:hypothetical protein